MGTGIVVKDCDMKIIFWVIEWWWAIAILVLIWLLVFLVAPYIETREQEFDRIMIELEERKERNKKVLYENLHYFKDPRTGLCFTGWIRGTASFVTHVPCEAVDKFEESK